MIRSLLCAGALVLFSLVAHAAPITFTFEGTVLNEAPFAGYTPGQAVVITYTLSSPASIITSDAENGIYNWDDYYMFDPAAFLFSSLTVTGLTGVWANNFNMGNYVMLVDGEPPLIAVNTFVIGAPNIGLYADGIGVASIFVQGVVNAPFVFDVIPVTLDYFADYLGVYTFAATGFGQASSIELEGNYHIYLDITKMTIATIPEPSTVMALLSGSVAWLFWRRRRVQ